MGPELYEGVLSVLLVVIAFIIGCYIGKMFEGPSGELIIDTSDPEKDKWLIKLEEPPEYAAKKHIVKLKVIHGQIKEGEVNGGT